jgi:hypothetical protein
MGSNFITLDLLVSDEGGHGLRAGPCAAQLITTAKLNHNHLINFKKYTF